jgi:nitric oxide dioxygenase
MTPQTIDQVQQSFRALLPHADELAEAVFLRLAKAEPALAPLFPANCPAHRRQFMASLAFAIAMLSDRDDMSPGLRALGATCRSLGIGAREIAAIRAALLDTIGQALGGAARGSRWTPELRAAWIEAADTLTRAMDIQPAPEAQQAAA